VLLKGYFPAHFRVTQIILILKSGKPNKNSYRPIKLLLTISNVFFKNLLLKRLLSIVESNGLIPNHQFGFRQRHPTIEWTHQTIQRLNEVVENKQYCSAAFSTSLRCSTKYGILDSYTG
jgi:hypothetical protein